MSKIINELRKSLNERRKVIDNDRALVRVFRVLVDCFGTAEKKYRNLHSGIIATTKWL